MSSESNEYTADRTRWGQGPWDSEPDDKVVWVSDGIDCMIVRNGMGAWCGYVGLPPAHPDHGKEYMEVLGEYDVHGGLTFASACGGKICHVPEPGRPTHVWWLGFDCNHSCDAAPDQGFWDSWGTYRTQDWVMDEVGRLAAQAKAAGAS
jgi:hypothetical protein